MNIRAQRVRNCLLGAALGEALSWPSLFTRSYQLPPWPRRILREMADFHERESITRLPLPFSLNQPADTFDLCPVAGTEWMMVMASALMEDGGEYRREKVLGRWLDLAAQEGVRGPVGVLTALDNIRKGLRPPVSGHDNPHYLDDSAMVRAIPIGTCYAGHPDAAGAAARWDASITNAEDGVIGAEAVARGIASACGGASPGEAIDETAATLPSESWIGRTVRRALESIPASAPSAGDPLAAIPVLHEIVNREYSYGGIASESLAVTLAVLKLSGGNFPTALLVAANVPKCAESVPMLVGAFAGALSGEKHTIPAEWCPGLSRLRGVAIPAMRGFEFIRRVEEIASTNESGAMR